MAHIARVALMTTVADRMFVDYRTLAAQTLVAHEILSSDRTP